ncbi:MAG: cadherin [Gammaproteobacteria bacterium]|nr:cadherin [Gammaproteobacteria bacterium]MBU1724847.1 cadherin [Gammaproteobacteria bacterium]MBU2006490.1 cadherin [Gammaproteobacteria bacterium]
MKTNKSFSLLHAMLGAIALTVAASSAFAEASLEYKLTLAEDGQTYQVWMKPSSTPKPDISLTGQVTIKAPHAAGFKVTNLKSAIEGSNWVEASRVDSPTEATGSDYISFSFVGLQGTSARNYAWSKDREQVVFSFENEDGCIDDVSLMADDDAFNVLSNSANTNPGNQFTNLGWGAVSENHYKGIYGDAISCKK